MSGLASGNFDTFVVKSHLIAARPDGRKALLIQTQEGRQIAFEIPDAILHKLAADLATLAAVSAPSNKPDA